MKATVARGRDPPVWLVHDVRTGLPMVDWMAELSSGAAAAVADVDGGYVVDLDAREPLPWTLCRR